MQGPAADLLPGGCDLVIVDVYENSVVPGSCAGDDLFTAVQARMKPRGVVGVNVVHRIQEPAEWYGRLRRVFPSQPLRIVQTGEAHNQSVALAAQCPTEAGGLRCFGEAELRRLATGITADTGLPFDLQDSIAGYEEIGPSETG